MLGELTKQEIENVIQSQSVCRIGCIDGKHPYIVPISYFYDGEYIYAQSREGKKIDLMRKNPNVCIEVDMITSMNNWRCVIAIGKFEELKGEESTLAREKLFSNVLTLMTNTKIHKFQHYTGNSILENNRVKLIMFSVKISEVSGRYEK